MDSFTDSLRTVLLAAMAAVLLPSSDGLAQQTVAPASEATAAAGDIANFFSQSGDQLYDCIFELSQEQIEVQQALVQAYVKQGASSSQARQLAVKQIHPPELSDKCKQFSKQISSTSDAAAKAWDTSVSAPKKPPFVVATPPKERPQPRAPAISLAGKKVLPQWDCGPGVDYVTIKHKGYERKLTGGEICNPFEDVVRPLPDTSKGFRLGYTIRTGRVFVVSDDPQSSGRTITWAISGREACRNNPDPDCLAARAVGPLPPGEYTFASEMGNRVSWGPTSKRMVAGIYLTKLWNKESYSPAQTAAIMARGNIAIHVRLKGEMSEACLGLGPDGWAYVSSLIKDGRAAGVNVYIDEPHPQIAEKPPIVVASSFSLSSLFK